MSRRIIFTRPLTQDLIVALSVGTGFAIGTSWLMGLDDTYPFWGAGSFLATLCLLRTLGLPRLGEEFEEPPAEPPQTF